MKDKAEKFGWLSFYESNNDFRTVFDHMYRVVESLPDSLISRGQELPFPQLHNACVDGDIDLVDALIRGGIPPDTYPCTDDEHDEPPLVWLAREPDMDPPTKLRVASLLLQHGADPEEGDAIEHAKENGDNDFAKFLRGQILKSEAARQ